MAAGNQERTLVLGCPSEDEGSIVARVPIRNETIISKGLGMETLEEAHDTILAQLTSDDPDVQAEYLKLFEAEAQEFSDSMAQAFMKWRSLDAGLMGNDKRAYISALVLLAINFHILSMKLFLSGHAVAAGNLSRQVVESIALALVCSGKNLGILEQFMEGKYSTKNAVRDVLRHAEKLMLNSDGVKALRDTQKFYDNYSHPTQLAIATGMSFSEKSGVYIGAAFDKGKVKAYTKEARSRVALAKIFPNFIDGVIANVAKW